MYEWIPPYFTGVAIPANIMPNEISCIGDQDLHLEISPYKSIAMIKVTIIVNLKSYAMQTLTAKIDLMHKQVITVLTSWRQPFCNAFWHGNQDGATSFPVVQLPLCGLTGHIVYLRVEQSNKSPLEFELYWICGHFDPEWISWFMVSLFVWIDITFRTK